MPRKTSDDLFILIRSLSKTEKGYFKSYAAMGNTKEDTIYLRLFDAIEAQKNYDEKKVLEKIRQENPQQLSNQKKYLGELILESLRFYHSRKSVDAQLWSSLCEIEVLYKKRLFKHCARQIKKAKELALRYEKDHQLAVLNTWEDKILAETIADKDVEMRMGQLFADNVSTTQKINTVARYRLLLNEIATLFRRAGAHQGDNIAKLNKMLRHPLINENNPPASFLERYYYYNLLGMIYFMLGKHEKSFRFRKKQMQDFELHPLQAQDSPRTYTSCLNNLIVSCARTGNSKELENAFYKIKHIMESPENAGNLEVQNLSLVCFNSVLYFYLKMGEFQKGVFLFEQMEDLFNRYIDQLSHTSIIAFYNNLAIIYFGTGNYKRALFWLNKILNDRDSDVREDIRNFAYLFNLVIHFERGNKSEVEYLARSVSRAFKAKADVTKVQTMMIGLFQDKVLYGNSVKEIAALFEQTLSNFQTYLKAHPSPPEFEYFDFISWLKSKVEKKKFSEVVGSTGY